ncbi:MAG: hypothetical protein WC734_06460 [Patescibacteria group bacterium]|jgi:hypothetical protein
MATYELWLTDDSGRRMFALEKYNNFAYSRSAYYLSTLQMQFNFKEWAKMVQPFFRPDWRIEVWRSPAYGYPMQREDAYMLRKPEVYTREEDAIQTIMLRGRNGMDLLNRRYAIQYTDTQFTTKTDYIDDMMKEIVREQCLYGSCYDYAGVLDNDRAFPQGEFTVQADLSLGPSVKLAFADRNVLDIIKELMELSFNMNYTLSTNRKIYFGVVPVELTGTTATLAEPNAQTGYEFRTFADLRGTDRTDGVTFSVENENLKAPTYIESHFDEVNAVFVKGQGVDSGRAVLEVENLSLIKKSRWNRCEGVRSATYETDASGLQGEADVALGEGKPIFNLDAVFLNSPGGHNTPRSLYGIDWDMGDLLPVSYAGKQFEIEVVNVYVAVNENGEETITGRNAQDAE